MTTEITDIKNLIYTPDAAALHSNRLLAEMEHLLPDTEIGICRSIQSLAYYLLPIRRAMESQKMVVVLFITQEEELRDLYEFRDLLEHINTIIILPEDADNLDMQAKELGPVQTTSSSDLSAALEKIVGLREAA